jgi:allantoinase
MATAVDRKIFPSTRMDQEWYVYSPFPERPSLRWPGGARVALYIVPALESTDALHPDQYPKITTPLLGQPSVRNASELDYGNRVGFWRVMDALDRYGLPATPAVDVLTAKRYPDVVEESLKRNWEIMSHGETATQVITGTTPIDEERELIQRSRDDMAAILGSAPKGWLSPAVSESTNTPGLLAEAGFTYTADWCNDDQPYAMRVGSGSLVAVPYSLAVNDREVIKDQHHTAWEFGQAGKDHFDSLYEEARQKDTGFVMCLALHPFCIGQPYRIKYLEDMLAHIISHAGVWSATGSEIVAAYLSQAPKA